MALIRINPENQYSALSTDIANSMIAGLSNVGAVVYLTDTKAWKIVNSNLTLSDYDLPVNFNGTVDIGTVDQGTGGSSAWKVTESNASAANTARSTATIVDPVQVIDASGNVLSATPSVSQIAATPPTATVMQNAVTQSAVGTDLTVTGYATAIIQIVSSPAMSGGTVVEFWATPDGSTYQPILAHQIGLAGNLVTSTSTDGEYRISVSGFKQVEARITGYSAGTVTVKGYVSPLAAFPTTMAGLVGGYTSEIDVTPTLTVHATYVTGDYVGTSGTAMVFAGSSRLNGGTGTVLSAVLIDYAVQSVACELWLFDTAVTPPADSAAWSITDADCARCVGVIPFSTYYASAANSVSFSQGVGIGFKTLAASTSIYGCLVTRGSPAYASGDLTVRLTIYQD